MNNLITALATQLTEWSYQSTVIRTDPFNAIDLDVEITHEDGASWRVPAFWGGGQEWRVRFAPPKSGRYQVVTSCSDPDDQGLQKIRTTLKILEYQSDNPLLKHGQLQLTKSQCSFEYADGKPFFWLGDTWWMGLSKRLNWPDDFQRLTADRVEKNFTIIQIVAGLLPDMSPFDERSTNEAGFPWEKDFSTINPAYFDMADLRINWLVRSGLMPCILGSWGYYLLLLGMDKMKKHWRYLIARWGAHPVIWCLAGEADMPYYLSESPKEESQQQREGWAKIGKYVQSIDPYSRLITVHPSHIGRDQVTDESVMDFNMLQTGHWGYESSANTIKTMTAELDRTPTMPIVVSEVNYEGIIHGTQAEIQRLTFWSSFLSGSAGYSYGANGIWQVNCRNKPYGCGPNGSNWGTTPWEDAYQLPGSAHLGLAAILLQRYEWWRFEAHQEWVTPSGSQTDVGAPFAAGIPGKIRIIYFYAPALPWRNNPIRVTNIEADVSYQAFFWDPRTGEQHDIGTVTPNAAGEWQVPLQPTFDDWILILKI